MPITLGQRLAVTALLIAASAAQAAPLHKCVINGTTTYQQSPCPSNQARKEPTLQELNAAEKKRKASAASTSAQAASANAVKTVTAPVPTTAFHCDGRQHCSQMTACAEAKQFLANCPGVKMDGDHNGIPCEKQWCSR